MNRMRAVVSTYFVNRKYGFLLDENGEYFFFHLSNYHGTPMLGERVEFELTEPNTLGKKKQAMNVTPVNVQESVAGGAQ